MSRWKNPSASWDADDTLALVGLVLGVSGALILSWRFLVVTLEFSWWTYGGLCAVVLGYFFWAVAEA